MFISRNFNTIDKNPPKKNKVVWDEMLRIADKIRRVMI